MVNLPSLTLDQSPPPPSIALYLLSPMRKQANKTTQNGKPDRKNFEGPSSHPRDRATASGNLCQLKIKRTKRVILRIVLFSRYLFLQVSGENLMDIAIGPYLRPATF